ncbi:MAG: acyltransferase [Verrucomicrobiota bacterium]
MILRKMIRSLLSSFRLGTRDVVLNAIGASVMVPTFLRYWIYRAAGLDVHTAKIYPRCFFGGRRVSIGKGTFVNYECFFDTSALIQIGERCAIGMGVYFITSYHEVGGAEERAGELRARSIKVGNGSWIGARAVLLPGVSIGEGCVIAAGAVVTRDCQPHALYAGVPARLVKQLD